MAWFKKNILFTLLMFVLAVVLAVEIFFVLGRRQTAVAAENDFNSKVEEYRRLAEKPVLPHENNVARTQAEIDRQREELLLYYNALRGDEDLHEDFTAYPASRSDAFFDIAAFVDEYRARLQNAGIEIDENESFGFGAYTAAGVGPEESEIPAVYKQRVIVAHLLDRLAEARPQRLVSLQRSGGAAPAEGRTGRGGQTGGAQQGAFRLDPQFSAAVPEISRTIPFQVVFTGHSDALRQFLNQLNSLEVPLMVRTVQVTGEGDQQQGGQQQRGQTGGRRRAAPREEGEATEGEQQQEAVPIVRGNVSQFTVALEFVDLHPVKNN